MLQHNFSSEPFSSPKRHAAWALLLILIVILVGAFFILDFKSKKLADLAIGQNATGEKGGEKIVVSAKDALNQQVVDVASGNASINDLIKKLGKHIFLPTGKVTVATVVDAEALRKENPIFYQYAKKGDRVVVYPSQAILYDPVLDIVLDVIHFPPTTTAPLIKK